jgi:hypothetical protein
MRTPFHIGALVWLSLGSIAGCQLLNDRQEHQQGQSPLRPAPSSPDSVAMEIVWARFPAGDPQLNELVWQEIDETPIAAGVQRELGKNGFRAGVIGGALPDALTRALHHGDTSGDESAAALKDQARALLDEPTIRRRLVQARRGRRVEVQASDVISSLPLLMGDGRELGGGTFNDAQAIYALKVDPQPDRMVVVELTPELHHGSPRIRWSRSEEGILRQAPVREREVFDRLQLTVRLAPGEMLVLMSLPDAGCRLGHYFHTVDAADGTQQKLILIRPAEVPPSGMFAGTNGN